MLVILFSSVSTINQLARISEIVHAKEPRRGGPRGNKIASTAAKEPLLPSPKGNKSLDARPSKPFVNRRRETLHNLYLKVYTRKIERPPANVIG